MNLRFAPLCDFLDGVILQLSSFNRGLYCTKDYTIFSKHNEQVDTNTN